MTRRPPFLIVLALLSAGAAFAVWMAAFHVPEGRSIDVRALQGFAGAGQPPQLEPSIEGVAFLADPLPFVLGGAALVLIALLRRRPLMAGLVPVVLLGANVTTQLLKPALADARIVDLGASAHVFVGSWPSGHSTAAMSIALCFVLVIGPRLRPLAALLGAGYAVAVGYALVALGHHLPSDVLGGYLVAATFVLLGAAALGLLQPRPEGAGRPAPVPVPVLAVIATTLLALATATAVAVAPGMTIDVLRHPSAMLAGAGIAALGLALTAGLATVLRP